jgi:hypothetical protein
MKEFPIDKNHFMGGWYINPDLCDRIVNEIDKSFKVFEYDKDREYNWMDLGEFHNDLSEEYCGELLKVLDQYKERFPLSHLKLREWGFTRPRLQKYAEGNSYHTLHCENDGNLDVVFRHLVFMTYLNDIEDGGGTYFENQKLTTPAEKGLTLIWPAQWTHYHKGIVAPTEKKYIITGWCCFYPPDQGHQW